MNDAVALVTVTSLLLVVVVYVWTAASLAAVFAKTGEEGYKAWIPVYNIVVLLQLAGLSVWLVLLILIPPALWVVVIVACHRVGRGFGAGAGMTVLAALLFPVWSSVLGWGSARWLGAGLRRRTAERPAHPAYPAPSAPLAAPAPAARPLAPAADAVHPAAPAMYAVPPRPPAPVAAPGPAASAPAPAAPAPAPAAPRPPTHLDPDPTPDLWADSDAGGIRLGRSRAPFTETVPTEGSAPAAPAPAAPRRAFAPEPGAVPPPVSPFSTVSAPPSAPAASAGPVAPVQDVPAPSAAPAAGEASDPWAPPIPLPNLPVPARAVRAPDTEAHLDDSAEVSAVAEVPALGGPRSARASVSSQHRRPEIPDEDVFDQTVVASRRRPSWSLVLPLGAPVAVTADVVIIGRRPSADLTRSGAQLVPVADDTRTVSKTHARLERNAVGWMIVDLDSTNGVVLVGEDGVETELEPGVAAPLTERFLLGDAELHLVDRSRDPGRAAGQGADQEAE
ncbi:MAG TPA: DUF5684 domain-containing protein [Microbacterium sp.]|nr:DUF5684 domain-containing protein [Microbacterium sp.]